MASRDSGNIGGTRVLHNSPGGGDPIFIHMLGVSPETRRRAGTGHELTPVEKLRIKHDKVSAQRKREGQRSEGNRRLVKEFEREHRRPPTYAEMLEILGGDPRRPGAGSVGGDTDFEDPEPRDLRRDFDFAALQDEIDRLRGQIALLISEGSVQRDEILKLKELVIRAESEVERLGKQYEHDRAQIHLEYEKIINRYEIQLRHVTVNTEQVQKLELHITMLKQKHAHDQRKLAHNFDGQLRDALADTRIEKGKSQQLVNQLATLKKRVKDLEDQLLDAEQRAAAQQREMDEISRANLQIRNKSGGDGE
ncbi:MAG: hypothetical protein HOL58_07520, partial [Francisellaceae bacterium]|nr:hypothetical protein [Francisellaceae bacterium]